MRHPTIAAVTLLALMGAGLSAQTTQSATASQQSACYVPGSGTVYRIKASNTPTQCSPGHVEFQLSAIGSAKPISGPTGPAGGDLAGDYPNPLVVGIQGHPVSSVAPANGQLMVYTSGAWAATTPSALTLPVNGAGSYEFSNPNGLVSNGTLSVGAIPATGAGTRMMWYPAKAAFRAGTVSDNSWDQANVGASSVAIGQNVKASGGTTVALGGYSTATADGAVAIGFGANATAIFSTAIGLNATASNTAAHAIGDNVTANALEATALGYDLMASGQYSLALGNHATTSGMTGSFVFGDNSTFTKVGVPLDNHFVVRAQGIWFGTNSSPTATSGRFIETSTGAYLTTSGVWTNVSDVHKKHDFKPVDGEQILEKLAAMPVSTWSYKADTSRIRHMGPTAQDFRAAFGLGDTDKAIGTIDADGVSLAAVKALIQRTTELRAENAELRSELAEIQRRLTELQTTKP